MRPEIANVESTTTRVLPDDRLEAERHVERACRTSRPFIARQGAVGRRRSPPHRSPSADPAPRSAHVGSSRLSGRRRGPPLLDPGRVPPTGQLDVREDREDVLDRPADVDHVPGHPSSLHRERRSQFTSARRLPSSTVKSSIGRPSQPVIARMPSTSKRTGCCVRRMVVTFTPHSQATCCQVTPRRRRLASRAS